ncbi:hypothetical protein [uncultured Desulfovibrio sp.]|uniref:hypothetical protein n=1 Tax=uncultured Desulfovibrio sp. TaxID=167968 RepID=UPI00272CEE45|nr:hypothetical protein [uncultured Desulfovibrio sp.]
MRKFRKKPVEIEAIQLEDNTECLHALSEAGLDPVQMDYADPNNPVLSIETPEGTMFAGIGDFIIKGVKGEFYPCKPDIFAATYEPAELEGTENNEEKARLAGMVLAGMFGQWGAEKRELLVEHISLNLNFGSGIGHSSMQSLMRDGSADR